ncbi:MAG: DnaJ domain-containing protein [Gammaproteobacteria bacterium]|nr:DnaJ domain-containing protein [Gammaproteobacteria bacterium]
MSVNYYDILGINKDATQDEIKKAYRNLASKYHPDVSKDPKATEKMSMINEAYDTLKDPQKRADYDQYGMNDYASFNSDSNTTYERYYYNYNPNSNYEYSRGYVYPKSPFTIGRFILTIVFLSIIATAIFRLISAGASYFSGRSNRSGFEYSYYDSTRSSVEITSYYGKDESISIPAYYSLSLMSSIPVVSLGDNLFENNTYIQEILINPNIEEIGKNVFKGCKNLNSIIFYGTEEEFSSWYESVTIRSGNTVFTELINANKVTCTTSTGTSLTVMKIVPYICDISIYFKNIC